MLKPLLFFAGVRCLMAIAMSQLLPMHDSRPLSTTFGDLALYNGSANGSLPLWNIPNPLFAALVRGLNYRHDQLGDWRFTSFSLVLNIAFSVIFVVLACKVLRPKAALLYAVFLGAHPYLALYSLKLDSSLFALLPVGLLATTALTKLQTSWSLLTTAVSSLFRNSLVPMGWLQLAWNRRIWRSTFGVLSISTLAASTALQLHFAAYYIGQNYGCYSPSRVTDWLGEQGMQGWAAKTLGFMLTPIIHLLLDLGAREAVANHCLVLPTSIAKQQWLHVGGTLFFMILHGWLLLRLIRTAWRHMQDNFAAAQLLFPLAMLLPTLYGAAHMRYLIPIIPLLLMNAFELRFQHSNTHGIVQG